MTSGGDRRRARRATWAVVAALAWAVAAAPVGAGVPLVELSGDAFGTTWHVRLPEDPQGPSPQALAQQIPEVLARVDARMSSWRSDSEIARFAAAPPARWFPVSAETAAVVAMAIEVHRRSEGAFDPTLAPLVDLWGFGPGPARQRPPDPEALERVRAQVGADALSVRRLPPGLRRDRADLALDLSAIAKGHAVDAVAEHLARLGVSRFLVEIGGELRARGTGPDRAPWPVGIERPEPGPQRVGWRIGLDDAAVATSGPAHRAFQFEGRRYAHVLDPRTGRPIAHDLVSVSVRAPETAWADAWATALLVLGPEEGFRVAVREGLAALFVRERNGALEARATPALEPHLLPHASESG